MLAICFQLGEIKFITNREIETLGMENVMKSQSRILFFANSIFIQLILTVIVLFVVSCSSPMYLTLVSPGITSEARLKKQSDLRMEEASFYGSWIYSHAAFYIDQLQLPKVLNDPNNLVFQSKEKFLIQDIDPNSIHILFEFCYDERKQINIEEDKKQYSFQLNDINPSHTIVYLYPYSYFKKGNTYRRKLPYYQSLPYPNDSILTTTGYDQLYCVRTLLSFDPSIEKRGTNRFTVTTPRNQNLFYEYEYNDQFVKFKEEEIN